MDMLEKSIQETLEKEGANWPTAFAMAVRKNLVIQVTDEMIEAYDRAEESTPGVSYDQTKAGLRAALIAAASTVAEHA